MRGGNNGEAVGPRLAWRQPFAASWRSQIGNFKIQMPPPRIRGLSRLAVDHAQE
jgi:hypothetical protein